VAASRGLDATPDALLNTRTANITSCELLVTGRSCELLVTGRSFELPVTGRSCDRMS
jgi:hypothetical protein